MRLSDREIHLWFVDVDRFYMRDDASALLRLYRSFLSEGEFERYGRFAFEKDRDQYLITRGLVRTVLTSYFGTIPPHIWSFRQNDYGKPFIDPSLMKCAPKFNLSHTDGMVVLGLSLECDVGVDVECTNKKNISKELAQYSFSSEEFQSIESLEGEDFLRGFFDFWTLKESYMKACGEGMSIPLQSFSFSFLVDGLIDLSFSPERDDRSGGWAFWQLAPSDRHSFALALKTTLSPDSYEIISRFVVPGVEQEDHEILPFRKSCYLTSN